MFHIDTTSPRWRQLAVVSLALPLSLVLTGTATAAAGDDTASSDADVSLDVGCFDISATSDKDISNVKVTFVDGTFEEINGLSGYTFDRTFTEQIASASVKSGNTQVDDSAGSCTTPPVVVKDVVVKDVVVKDVVVKDVVVKDVVVKDVVTLPATGEGTAAVSISVDCNTVKVSSDKDISNVKVTFVDGSFEEINGLDGYTFERTFSKPIDFATAKSAGSEVLGDAEACAAVEPGVTTVVPPVVPPLVPPVVTTVVTPVVVDTTPICPTGVVMGPVMQGCEDLSGQPAPQPATGGGVVETPVRTGTPVTVDTPAVVAEETPAQAPVGTPISGRPAPQAVGGAAGAVPAPAAAPLAGQPAQAPLAGQPAQAPVVANSAVAPAALATVSAPAALPFTGSDTDALLQLGSVLVLVGGGALLAGRRHRPARHARTAKHARLA